MLSSLLLPAGELRAAQEQAGGGGAGEPAAAAAAQDAFSVFD